MIKTNFSDTKSNVIPFSGSASHLYFTLSLVHQDVATSFTAAMLNPQLLTIDLNLRYSDGSKARINQSLYDYVLLSTSYESNLAQLRGASFEVVTAAGAASREVIELHYVLDLGHIVQSSMTDMDITISGQNAFCSVLNATSSMVIATNSIYGAYQTEKVELFQRVPQLSVTSTSDPLPDGLSKLVILDRTYAALRTTAANPIQRVRFESAQYGRDDWSETFRAEQFLSVSNPSIVPYMGNSIVVFDGMGDFVTNARIHIDYVSTLNTANRLALVGWVNLPFIKAIEANDKTALKHQAANNATVRKLANATTKK